MGRRVLCSRHAVSLNSFPVLEFTSSALVLTFLLRACRMDCDETKRGQLRWKACGDWPNRHGTALRGGRAVRLWVRQAVGRERRRDYHAPCRGLGWGVFRPCDVPVRT